MDASSMERISQWVASQEIPSDLTIRVGDSVFPLHKAVMVPKCGYIRRAVAAARKDGYITELDLSSIPGGAAAFEKAALYCYAGAATTTTLDITASNAAPLLCAAAFLDIHQSSDGGGLVRRVEEFLAQTGLRSLQNAVAVLRSCERVGPAADELGVARRAADVVALKVCNEALFPSMTTRPAGWWAAELAALSPASFGKVVTALRCRHAAPEVVAAAAAAYAELLLLDPTTTATTTKEKKGGAGLLEAVVDALPPSSAAPLPATLLCRLLHAAVTVVHAAATTCRDLELRVAAVLDQATADDLLAMALDAAGEHLTNTDTIRRVIAAFVERHHHHQEQQQHNSGTQSRNRRSSLCVERRGGGGGGDDDDSTSSGRLAEKRARTVGDVDEVAAELATEEELTVSKFVGVCGAVPRDARASHDYLYRAVDIYLKTHPGLDEIQREKVCSVMDPLRLSYQARLHASQNKRLPLQAVLTALYYDNLNLRSSSTTMITTTTPPPAIAAGVAVAAGKNNNHKVDEQQHSLARENEALRLELAQMRAYLSAATAQQQQHNGAANSKGGSASSRAALPPAAKKKKARSFLSMGLGSVVTRTLSRLNPFKPGGYWAAAKDTSSVADGRYGNTIRDHVLKPKRRRFSIS
ncbi:hypothetical protein PR202_ga24948 [Eleusine coracana subsp. coracana]|uniref:NPH3 domain-containing protein n=1 Tax=Eleusine coracana subsp. coracana TaxID=191504 RepID=A0AAV5DA60_ELECO|nr:hypothetical protein PR202_ga24948 [Eleusine coracana subsp. coracana]